MLNGWTLKVTVDGIQANDTSEIAFGLFRPDDLFPRVGKEYKGNYLTATSSSVTYRFHDLESGKYAVSIFHDMNGNHQLDNDFFGVPVEGYCFSNNVRGVFSAPSFDDASIVIDQDKSITITIIY